MFKINKPLSLGKDLISKYIILNFLENLETGTFLIKSGLFSVTSVWWMTTKALEPTLQLVFLGHGSVSVLEVRKLAILRLPYT